VWLCGGRERVRVQANKTLIRSRRFAIASGVSVVVRNRPEFGGAWGSDAGWLDLIQAWGRWNGKQGAFNVVLDVR